MNEEQKKALGAQITRLREAKPLVTQDQLAVEANLAPNTVGAVERGEGADRSVKKVLAAMERLGRPVHVPVEDAPQEVAFEPHPAQLVGDLVTTLLKAAPPGEYEDLERNVWLLVRGRHTELISRLRQGQP